MQPTTPAEADYKQLTKRLYAAVFPTVLDFVQGQQHPDGRAGETRAMLYQAGQATLAIVEEAIKPIKKAVEQVSRTPEKPLNIS